jgi:hypothetical protein
MSYDLEIERLVSNKFKLVADIVRLRAWAEDEQLGRHKAEEDRVSLRSALNTIADIAEGSGTVNSLPHIAKLARAALTKGRGA